MSLLLLFAFLLSFARSDSNVPQNVCCYKFTNPQLPTYILPSPQPNSPGDITLNLNNPIILANNNSLNPGQGCNGDDLEYWDFVNSKWVRNYIGSDGQNRPNIDLFYTTNGVDLNIRTIQTWQSNMYQVLNGTYLRLWITCNNGFYSCIEFTVNLTNTNYTGTENNTCASPNPIPSPSPPPSPPPSPTDPCLQPCATRFLGLQSSWTRSTPFSAQCLAWENYVQCLEDCADGGDETQDVEINCRETKFIGDLCACGSSPRSDGSRVIAILFEFKDLFLAAIIEFNGVSNAQWPSSFSGDTIVVEFTYDDSKTSVDAVITNLRSWLAQFLNQPPDSFDFQPQASSKKRNAVTTSLAIQSVPQTQATGGVAGFTVSFALVLSAVLFALF